MPVPAVPTLELERCAVLIQSRQRGRAAREHVAPLKHRQKSSARLGGDDGGSGRSGASSRQRRRSSAVRLLTLDEKAQLEAVLGESIQPALGLHPQHRLRGETGEGATSLPQSCWIERGAEAFLPGGRKR